MKSPKLIATLLFCAACFVSSSAVAELRIGFVNAAKLLEEAPQAAAARDNLQQEFAPRDRELVSMQKEIKALEEKLGRDAAVMSESERRNLERDILNRKRDLKRSQDVFREDFNLRRNEELGKLQRLVIETIRPGSSASTCTVSSTSRTTTLHGNSTPTCGSTSSAALARFGLHAPRIT